jgi:hypothetical protein
LSIQAVPILPLQLGRNWERPVATLIAPWSPYTTLALIAASALFYVLGGFAIEIG